MSLSDATDLAEELAEELPPQPRWRPVEAPAGLKTLAFGELDDELAADVLARFHYLRSPRPGGRTYGLTATAGELLALCVSSPLDVPHVSRLLSTRGRAAATARVVSRVFAFEGAPHNTLSFLLGKACRCEAARGVTDLVTYVNPNMGFCGSSYRASGWALLGEERGTRYRYLDDRYATDRALASAFGPHDDRGFVELLGDRFTSSVMSLAPLLVFWRPLTSTRAGGSAVPRVSWAGVPGSRARMSQPDPYPPIEPRPSPLPDPEPLPEPPTPQPPIPDPLPI